MTPRNDFWHGRNISTLVDDKVRREMLEELEGRHPAEPCDLESCPIISSTVCPECGAGVGESCFPPRLAVHFGRGAKFARA